MGARVARCRCGIPFLAWQRIESGVDVADHAADGPEHVRVPRIVRFALLGLLWLALAWVFWLRFRHDAMDALRSLPRLGLAMCEALGLFIIWTAAASAGWRALCRAAALGQNGSVPSLLRLAAIRIQAQALNLVLPTAGLAGETWRAVSSSQTVADTRGSIAAVVLDNVASGVSGLALAALCAPLLAASVSGHWCEGILACAALAASGLAVERVPFALAPRALRFVPPAGRVASVLRILADSRSMRPALRRAVAWHLVERVVAIGEVYVVFLALSIPATLVHAAAISSLFVLVSFAAFFVPGQVGVADLLVVIVCAALGLPPAAGIGVAAVRRVRQLAACLAGMALMLLVRRPPPPAAEGCIPRLKREVP